MSETLVAHTDPVTGETVMLPPASGAVIDIAPRRDGQGGVGSAGEGYSVGSGRGAGVGAAGPVPVEPPAPAPMEAPSAVGAAAPASIQFEVVGARPAPEAMFGGSADRVASVWEARWLARQGIGGAPMQQPQPAPQGDGTEMRAQPDPAGFDAIRSPTEPRRGTLRLSPNGTPQMPEGMPLPPRPPEAQASAPLGEQLLGMVRDTFMATAQGYSEGALATAQAVADAEMQRRLAPTFNDDGPAVERLRAARERAAEMGIEIAFRARPDGAVEAVRVTPAMQTPGGAVGRFADGLGRLLGLAFVDPMGGAAVLGARGSGGAINAASAASSGGVGARVVVRPYDRAARQARQAVDARINRNLPGAEGAVAAMSSEGLDALREAMRAAYREELLRAISALPEAERTQALLEHMRRTVPSTISTAAT